MKNQEAFDEFYDAVIKDTDKFFTYEIPDKREVDLQEQNSRKALQCTRYVRKASKAHDLAALQS